MSERRRNEKEEEKSSVCREWWRQDRIDAVGWAAVFIWGALVLLAETTNFAANFSWWNGWGVFFAGVGVIVLVGTVARLFMPEYRRPVVGGLIFGFILLGIGLGGWVWVWPLVLIVIAVIILLSAFARRR